MSLKDEVVPKAQPDSGPPKPGPGTPPAEPPTARQAWRSRLTSRRGLMVLGALIVIVIAAIFFGPKLFKSPASDYVTAPVTKGTVTDTVTALGNLQPLNYVDVGAQVSGQIKVLHVNIGDQVKKGDLLVEIDPQVQQEKVNESQSQLASMQATLLDRQATLKLKQAEAARETRLHAEGADSVDAYEAALAAASSAAAAVKSQEAQIAQAQSSLSADLTTLGFSKILAPMDGTVVSVALKQGQTINASQQAPTILRIADLSTMTVWTQVSEADVSRLRVGMPVYFTTLGDPNTRYEGKLRQILPTPEVLNNVILFDVLFDVANPRQALMTQMTAQATFTAAEADNVLTVPVAALQIAKTLAARRPGQGGQRGAAGASNAAGAGAPATATTAPASAEAPAAPEGNPPATEGAATTTTTTTTTAATPGADSSAPGANGGRRHRGAGAGQGGAPSDAQRAAWRASHGGGRTTRQFVMVVKGGALERREVVVGVSDRITAEIKSGLTEGEEVVIGRKQAPKTAATPARSALQGAGGPGGGGFGGRGGGR